VTIITCGLLNSCTGDLKDRIKGQWISHETILTAELEKKIDTVRIVNFNADGTFYAIGNGKEFLGTWTQTNKKAGKEQNDLITVTVDSSSIVYEISEINDDELVLKESSVAKGTGVRIPFKRVKM
jgi:hypothetical protein